MQTRTEEIATPNGPMGVQVVRPDGEGPFPVIVFFHHGPGLDDGSKQTMARIAEWGYYVVAHDRYHRAEPWYTMQDRNDDEMKKLFGLIQGTTRTRSPRILTPCSSGCGRTRPGGAMGCIGYCIGARSVLRTLRDLVTSSGRRWPAPVVVHHRRQRLAAPRRAVLHRVVVHRVRLGRHHAARICQHGAHRGDQRVDQGRGRDPRRRRPRVRRVRPPPPRGRCHAVHERAKVMFDRELRG